MTARPAPADDEEARLLVELSRVTAQAGRIAARLSHIQQARAAGRAPPPTRDPDLLSAKEASALLGVSRDTAIRWAKSFYIGHRLPSGMWQFFRHKIEDMQRGELPAPEA